MKYAALVMLGLCLCAPTLSAPPDAVPAAPPDSPSVSLPPEMAPVAVPPVPTQAARLPLSDAEKAYLLVIAHHAKKMSACFKKVDVQNQSVSIENGAWKQAITLALEELQQCAQEGQQFVAPARFQPVQELYAEAMAQHEDAAKGLSITINAPTGIEEKKKEMLRYAQEMDAANLTWKRAFALVYVLGPQIAPLQTAPDGALPAASPPVSPSPPNDAPPGDRNAEPPAADAPLIPLPKPGTLPERKVPATQTVQPLLSLDERAYSFKLIGHGEKIFDLGQKISSLSRSTQSQEEKTHIFISALKSWSIESEAIRTLHAPPRLRPVQRLYAAGMLQCEMGIRNLLAALKTGDEKAYQKAYQYSLEKIKQGTATEKRAAALYYTITHQELQQLQP